MLAFPVVLRVSSSITCLSMTVLILFFLGVELVDEVYINTSIEHVSVEISTNGGDIFDMGNVLRVSVIVRTESGRLLDDYPIFLNVSNPSDGSLVFHGFVLAGIVEIPIERPGNYHIDASFNYSFVLEDSNEGVADVDPERYNLNDCIVASRSASGVNKQVPVTERNQAFSSMPGFIREYMESLLAVAGLYSRSLVETVVVLALWQLVQPVFYPSAFLALVAMIVLNYIGTVHPTAMQVGQVLGLVAGSQQTSLVVKAISKPRAPSTAAAGSTSILNQLRTMTSPIVVVKLILLAFMGLMHAWRLSYEQRQTYNIVEYFLIRTFTSAVLKAYITLSFIQDLFGMFNIDVSTLPMTAIISALAFILLEAFIMEVIVFILDVWFDVNYYDLPWYWLVLIETIRWTVRVFVVAFILAPTIFSAASIGEVINAIIMIILPAIGFMIFSALIDRVVPKQKERYRDEKDKFCEKYSAKFPDAVEPLPGAFAVTVRRKVLRQSELMNWIPTVVAAYLVTCGLAVVMDPGTPTLQQLLYWVVTVMTGHYFGTLVAMLDVWCNGYQILYADIPFLGKALGANADLTLNLLAALRVIRHGPDVVARKLASGQSKDAPAAGRIAIAEAKGTVQSSAAVYPSLFTSTMGGRTYHQPSRQWLVRSNRSTNWMYKLSADYRFAYNAMDEVLNQNTAYDVFAVVGSACAGGSVAVRGDWSGWKASLDNRGEVFFAVYRVVP